MRVWLQQIQGASDRGGGGRGGGGDRVWARQAGEGDAPIKRGPNLVIFNHRSPVVFESNSFVSEKLFNVPKYQKIKATFQFS